jgi:hypothetical protein
LSTITASKGLGGMTKLHSGTYVWNKQVPWHFADTSDNQQSKLAITYTIS